MSKKTINFVFCLYVFGYEGYIYVYINMFCNIKKYLFLTKNTHIFAGVILNTIFLP